MKDFENSQFFDDLYLYKIKKLLKFSIFKFIVI